MKTQTNSFEGVTPQDFFINKGLYEVYDYSATNIKDALPLVFYNGFLECYCVECAQQSIFKGMVDKYSPYVVENPEKESMVFALKNSQTVERRFTCSRSPSHKLYFTILLNYSTFSKVGQFPSYADISLQDVEKYKRLLPNDLFIEFKKSIGLYTHNVGVGSIVYLRRIIEKYMIEPAYQEAKLSTDWEESVYQKARMSERIKLLKAYLPSYLVDNTVIYGIVSKGIHELSEKECLQYFPILKSFIEVVLTDMKNKKDEEDRKKELADALSSIAKKI